MMQEMLQEVRFIDIGLVPYGNNGREPHVFNGGPSDHGNAKGPALGDDGDISRPDFLGAEGGVEGAGGRKDSEDVRAEDAHAVLAGTGDDPVFLLAVSYLRKSGGDDRDEFDPLLAAALHGIKDKGSGNDDASDIDFILNLIDVLVSPKAEDLTSLG